MAAAPHSKKREINALTSRLTTSMVLLSHHMTQVNNLIASIQDDIIDIEKTSSEKWRNVTTYRGKKVA